MHQFIGRFTPCLAVVTILCLLSSGCGSGKGQESDQPLEGMFDSFRNPTDHGTITFDQPVVATLSKTALYHAWRFQVWGATKITAFTAVPTGKRKVVDTVLYLYHQQPNGGFGSYIARNDDSGGTLWSRITKNLTGGTYRVLVKGYSSSDLGDFQLTVQCQGGCQAPVQNCLFGENYADIRYNPSLTVQPTQVLTAASQLTVLQGQQLIRAVQVSNNAVTTVAEAFASVDQGQVNYTPFTDIPGAGYAAFEYGAGDNSYGAVLYGTSADAAVEIHDGDLYLCKVFDPDGAWSNLTVTAESLPAPLTGITQLHAQNVQVLPAGKDIPASARLNVLAQIKPLVEGSCPEIPTGTDAGLERSYLDFLTGMVQGVYDNSWKDRLTPAQIQTLDDYLTNSWGGDGDLEILDGRPILTGCAQAPDGHFFVIHHRPDHQILFLLMYM